MNSTWIYTLFIVSTILWVQGLTSGNALKNQASFLEPLNLRKAYTRSKIILEEWFVWGKWHPNTMQHWYNDNNTTTNIIWKVNEQRHAYRLSIKRMTPSIKIVFPLYSKWVNLTLLSFGLTFNEHVANISSHEVLKCDNSLR